MYSEVLRIIEGGLHNDVRKIVNYSQRLATHFESEGDFSMAKSIHETLERNRANLATMDQYMNLPVDTDSRLQMVEVVPPIADRTQIVLEDLVDKQVSNFIDLVMPI